MATASAGGSPSAHGGGAPRSRRVLIIEDDTLVGMGLRGQLERLGHAVVGQAADAAESASLFRAHEPDLVLIDIRLNGDDGLDVAAALLKERPVATIVISAYSDPDLIRRAGDAGVFGYLIKPVSIELLAAQIEIAVARFGQQEKLLTENQALQQSLETRKLVERAKGILIKRLNLTEPDAHKRLQTESQKRRITMADVARKVIESEELLGS